MIRLRNIVESVEGHLPSPKFAAYLLKKHVVTLSEEWLYHGTPKAGLKRMLTDGIYGTQHGEIAEYDTFSTSFNSEVISMFSDGDGETGLQFHVKDISVLVMDDVLAYLATQAPGSGLDLEVDPEKLAKYAKAFKLPLDRFSKTPSIPYGYLSSLGVDAVMFDYVWKRYQRGHAADLRDESEVCFIGKGIDKLNHCITDIYVEGTSFDNKEEALQAIGEVDDQS
jgi:hypothetical protein